MDWRDAKIEEHNKEQAVEGNKMIDLDPEIAAMFHKSSAISGKRFDTLTVLSNLTILFFTIAKKGVSAHLLK